MPDLLDPAVVHHRNLVGDLHRFLLIVRDEHRRDMHLVVEPPEPRAQLGPHARVERAERLVEQENLRLDGQGSSECHPLPLSAGELRRIPGCEGRELDELEQLGDTRPDLSASAACGL